MDFNVFREKIKLAHFKIGFMAKSSYIEICKLIRDDETIKYTCETFPIKTNGLTGVIVITDSYFYGYIPQSDKTFQTIKIPRNIIQDITFSTQTFNRETAKLKTTEGDYNIGKIFDNKIVTALNKQPSDKVFEKPNVDNQNTQEAIVSEKVKKCRFCGKEVAINAKICPSCGKKIKSPLGSTLLIILGILIAFSFITKKKDADKDSVITESLDVVESESDDIVAENTQPALTNPDAWKEEDNSIQAKVILEGILREQYAPRKVDFPGWMNDDEFTVMRQPNQLYLITSYIDVQNDFGVMTRINYFANMQQIGPDEYTDWDLVHIEIIDN